MTELELKDYTAIKYMLKKYPGYCLDAEQADRIYEWADEEFIRIYEGSTKI